MARIDWNIRSRARACMKCARDFVEKEPVRSSVLAFETPLVREIFAERLAEEEKAAAAGQPVRPHPEYVRLDFCEDCWKGLPKTDWISVWRSPYVPPETAPEDPLKKASPETLLRRLLEADDAETHLAPIYLLAVMLERKLRTPPLRRRDAHRRPPAHRRAGSRSPGRNRASPRSPPALPRSVVAAAGRPRAGSPRPRAGRPRRLAPAAMPEPDFPAPSARRPLAVLQVMGCRLNHAEAARIRGALGI